MTNQSEQVADPRAVRAVMCEMPKKNEQVVMPRAGPPVMCEMPKKNEQVVLPRAGPPVMCGPLTKQPLAVFSLLDRTDAVERQMVEQVPILGSVGLLGQASVFYAVPNTGKTLLVLHLVIDGIKRGVIDPAKMFYINMDDNSQGLLEKLRIVDEYRFNMLADGYQGFEAKFFLASMLKMIDEDTARGVVVVLDTLKKFVNTMDKAKSSGFARVIRQFVLKGGTVIALAHANKHPGSDGKPIYSGTTDIVDDFDCAFTLAALPQQSDASVRVVEFANIKRRGNVALAAAYSYALESDLSYAELVLSVREVEPNELLPMKVAAALVTDAELVAAISACISEGVNTKMELASAAAGSAKCSKRAALRVIEKYAGDDPNNYLWSFKVGGRGAKIFALLEARPEPGFQVSRSPASLPSQPQEQLDDSELDL